MTCIAVSMNPKGFTRPAREPDHHIGPGLAAGDGPVSSKFTAVKIWSVTVRCGAIVSRPGPGLVGKDQSGVE